MTALPGKMCLCLPLTEMMGQNFFTEALCEYVPRAGEDRGLSRQLEITAAALTHFDFQLYQAIELYHGRIRWLNQGSMKVFGLVKGSRVGVIVETSDAVAAPEKILRRGNFSDDLDVNCTKDRLPDLQRNLLSLIEEQLSCKSQLYLMSCGTETSSLWDGPRDVNPFRRLMAEWMSWEPGGGCNLLQALKRGCTQLDSLVIILGSSPDQTSDALFDYVVSYCSISPLTIATVKRLAEVTWGRHHIFSASLGVVDSSTDVELLWTEIKAARELLGHTEALVRDDWGT
ncbi:hypothetical protein J4Q44_G00178340 [Coregonus suidteri]|uniref:VWFA domain-containing protein n=1 Tax=Coregonus suidteri TaxID=861788 RepID=A0AAN8QQA1_9TELE